MLLSFVLYQDIHSDVLPLSDRILIMRFVVICLSIRFPKSIGKMRSQLLITPCC